MPLFSHLLVTNRLACETPTALYTLTLADLEANDDINDLAEEEALTFGFKRLYDDGAVRSLATALRNDWIARVVWDDESFDEWPIEAFQGGRGSGGIISVGCRALIDNLTKQPATAGGKGFVSNLVGGIRNYQFAITDRNVTSAAGAYLFGAEDIPRTVPTWLTLGTVDAAIDAVTVEFALDRMTPKAFVIALRDAVRSQGVACEFRLRRNGTTDYKLDFVTEVGASADVPLFHPDTNLQTCSIKRDGIQQVTRAFVRAQANPDGAVGILGLARWIGGTPSGNDIAMSDPNGGSGPIGFANQWARVAGVPGTGCYALHCKSGMTSEITASSKTTQKFSLAGPILSTMIAGDEYEIRLTEPLTLNLKRPPATAGSQLGTTISSVASTVLTLSTTQLMGATAPGTYGTDANVGWYVRRATPVVGPTTSKLWNADTDSLTPSPAVNLRLYVSSTASINVDDIITVTTSSTRTAFHGTIPILVVDAIGSGYVDCHARDVADAATATLGGAHVAYVYRPVATKQRITAQSISPQTVTVDTAGGAAADDFIELVQHDGAGEIPQYVEHPDYVRPEPDGYGPKIGGVTRDVDFGIQQWMRDAGLSDWPGSAVVQAVVTNAGTGYSSMPSIGVSGGGGSGAAVAPLMGAQTVGVAAAGSGYSVNDIITLTGGTFSAAVQVTVTEIGGSGEVLTVSLTIPGNYSVLPSNPVAQGSVAPPGGTGATINITAWTMVGATVTAGGTGYTSSPTLTVTGGGGSNAYVIAGMSMPTGWTETIIGPSSGTAGIVSKVQTPNVLGTNSLKFDYHPVGSGGHGSAFTSTPAYVTLTPGINRVSVRARVWFDTYSGAGIRSSLTVKRQDGTNAATALTVQPTNGGGGGITTIGTGYFAELKIENIDLTDANRAKLQAITVAFQPLSTAATGTVIGYLDAIEVYPYSKCPDKPYPYGDCHRMTQVGNQYLEQFAPPPIIYEMNGLDLARAFKTEYDRVATTLGGQVRIVDREYGIDVTARLIRRERNLLKPSESKFTLGNRNPLLTTTIQTITKTVSDAISEPTPSATIPVPAGSGGTPIATALTREVVAATPMGFGVDPVFGTVVVLFWMVIVSINQNGVRVQLWQYLFVPNDSDPGSRWQPAIRIG